MKVIHDFPASKLRKELRGDIPKDAKVIVTIETADEISASLAVGFKQMKADREALDAVERSDRRAA